MVVIDYAHTPDALEKVLLALKPVALSRAGRLWCVFGCGGDRDASKRPLMAAAAQRNADQILVTSDNPRTEDPHTIIDQILLGLACRDGVTVQADRAAAIFEALHLAQPSDVVLLAGKGHEDYQEIQGVKLAFSDRDHAQARTSDPDLLSGRAVPAICQENQKWHSNGETDRIDCQTGQTEDRNVQKSAF